MERGERRRKGPRSLRLLRREGGGGRKGEKEVPPSKSDWKILKRLKKMGRKKKKDDIRS